jgi:hypothetical protein
MTDMVFSRGRCLQMSALAGCSMLVGDHLFAYEQPALKGFLNRVTIPTRFQSAHDAKDLLFS